MASPAPAAHRFPSTALWWVSFTGPEHGYGYYIQRAGSQCRGIVARTSNGGARFTHAVVVHAWPCAGGLPWQLELAANNRGDAFLYGANGAGLLASHDCGATWSRVRIPGTVLAVSAVAGSVWMLSQTCVLRTFPFCRVHMRISSDGGRRWRKPAAQPSRSGRFELAAGAATGQTWLLRTGQSSGYVVLPPGFDAVHGHGVGAAPLLSTRNGGRSWTSLRIPCARSMISVMLTAVPRSPSRLAAVCAGLPSQFHQRSSWRACTSRWT